VKRNSALRQTVASEKRSSQLHRPKAKLLTVEKLKIIDRVENQERVPSAKVNHCQAPFIATIEKNHFSEKTENP
jgi:hypothetical protein